MDLYERDIEDLPVILALQNDIRIKPDKAGGQEIKFKGLSVNNVLDEGKPNSNNTQINLAPFDENLTDNEVIPVMIPSGYQDKDIAEAITTALEGLLGLDNQKEKPLDDSIELHIASYSTADKANAHWFLLQQVNSDLLENYNHQVVKVSKSNEELYRLRVVGFNSIALAQDMCARLIERGETCIPAVGTQ